MTISAFRDEYRFLSNFWVEKDGSTVEHYYQAMKSTDDEVRAEILSLPTPGAAKRAGAKVELRPDWDDVKFQIMAHYVSRKFFRDEELAKALVDTGADLLIEGNTWGDHYWGAEWVDGKESWTGDSYWTGENNLGKILMTVRSSLMHSKD